MECRAALNLTWFGAHLKQLHPLKLIDNPGEHFHPERQDVFVYVEMAAVEGIDDSLLFVAASQPEKGTRDFLEIISKIFSTHGRP
jgi:hypothetical protein